MIPAILWLGIRYEHDVVLARQRARQIAALLRVDAQDQTRIATAVSEIARNAFTYAGGGKIEFSVTGNSAPQVLLITVTDNGPGITHLASILDGRYRSPTGMGLGIIGARRLMDQFHIDTAPGRGTTVTLKKLLPATAPLVTATSLSRLTDQLARLVPHDAVEEIQQQNQELLRALDELRSRQDELGALNHELEDTNRGVVALYAELDERADHLRRADELKSRFLSNMSHEFRTPVNSIQALARMLLDRTDGDLTAEQETQVTFIRKAADSLSELVNDLLDLAKVEAGKIVVHPVDFEVTNLFGALRGMLRPLLVSDGVALVFDESDALPPLHTDEAKVSQILRNFISNALKFTESGEIRVSARRVGDTIAFDVSDTGIGIAPEDQDRIFQEFTQLDSPIQRRVRGTGLGLPLCRKLAGLLGGSVSVASRLGLGSTFSAVIPIVYADRRAQTPRTWDIDAGAVPVLVVEDAFDTILLYERFVAGTQYQILPAQSLHETRAALAAVRPKVVVLDLLLRGEDSWALLAELKGNAETHDIPVIVVSTVEDERKVVALGADAFFVKPIDRYTFLHTLTKVTAPETIRRVLVADDEEISRYVLRQHLTTARHTVDEAASGAEAIDRARSEHPDVICLDLMMPGQDGFEVLRELKADPTTRDIPVVIVTSKHLSEGERRQLLELASGILPKEALSHERAVSAIDEALRLGGRAA